MTDPRRYLIRMMLFLGIVAVIVADINQTPYRCLYGQCSAQ